MTSATNRRRIVNSNGRQGGELHFEFSTFPVIIRIYYSMYRFKEKWIDFKKEPQVNEACGTLMIGPTGWLFERALGCVFWM